jgi:predicted amidohydrolase
MFIKHCLIASGSTYVKGISFGIAMCIESHIPEISKILCKNGAEVLIFPFATPSVCGNRKEIWNKYLPARAYDNNAYVIATNLYGGMMAITPDGEVITENYIDDTIVVKIDTEEVKKRRSKYKLNYNGRVKNEVLGKVGKYGF